MANKLINVILGSFFLAAGLSLLFKIAFNSKVGYLFVVFFALIVYLLSSLDSARHIWRRTFIFLSVESFLMPLAGVFGVLNSNAIKSGEFAMILGGLFAGGMLVVLLAILGFILGIIFLLIGLLVFRISKRK